MIKHLIRLLACLPHLLWAAPLWAAAGGFVDPLVQPAMPSGHAERALVNALAQAGQRLLAAGQRGHILYSDDGGRQWQQAQVPLSADLVALHFSDSQRGWAVGHDGVVLHSADGGRHWQRQFDGRSDTEVGDKPLLDVWFDRSGHGMAVGAFGLALCSDDAGQHWQHCEGQLENPQGLHLYAIRAIGDALYLVGEQGLVLRRAGNERKFSSVSTPYQGSYFGIAGEGSNLLLYGLRGKAVRSEDGGRNWQSVSSATQTGLTGALRLADGSWLLATQGGQLLLSRDGARSFTPLAGIRPGPLSAVLAVTPKQLLIGGARGLRLQAVELP